MRATLAISVALDASNCALCLPRQGGQLTILTAGSRWIDIVGAAKKGGATDPIRSTPMRLFLRAMLRSYSMMIFPRCSTCRRPPCQMGPNPSVV